MFAKRGKEGGGGRWEDIGGARTGAAAKAELNKE
jgi:hypothetical protein